MRRPRLKTFLSSGKMYTLKTQWISIPMKRCRGTTTYARMLSIFLQKISVIRKSSISTSLPVTEALIEGAELLRPGKNSQIPCNTLRNSTLELRTVWKVVAAPINASKLTITDCNFFTEDTQLKSKSKVFKNQRKAQKQKCYLWWILNGHNYFVIFPNERRTFPCASRGLRPESFTSAIAAGLGLGRRQLHGPRLRTLRRVRENLS